MAINRGLENYSWNGWLVVLVGVCVAALGCQAEDYQRPVVLQAESPESALGFVSIFNGTDTTAWVLGGDEGMFRIEDGLLIAVPGGPHGWIYTEQTYQNFQIRFEYRAATPMANSGLFFRAAANDPVYAGMEIQILGDYGHQPNKHSGGALYDVKAAAENASRPVGQWNNAELICQGPLVTYTLNGKTVLHLNLDDYPEPVGKFPTAYKDLPRGGHIGLQNHGDELHFRDVRIKVLD